MLNHVLVGTNDIERARAFYDALLPTVLGSRPGIPSTSASGHQRVFYIHDGNTFGVTQPINDQSASCANGFTLGFKCHSAEQVKQFHDVAVANGATSIEDPPGPRTSAMGTVHLAYVRDPDGHKLCAIYRQPKG